MNFDLSPDDWHLLRDALDALAEKDPRRAQECSALSEKLRNMAWEKARGPGIGGAVMAVYGAAPTMLTGNEASSYDLILTGVKEGCRLNVIRSIRQLTRLGLIEARALTDRYPTVILSDVWIGDVQTKRRVLEEAGALLEVRSVSAEEEVRRLTSPTKPV